MLQYKYVYESGFDGCWHNADGVNSPALRDDRVLRVLVRESPTQPEPKPGPVMQYRHHFRDGGDPGMWWDVPTESAERLSAAAREVRKVEFRVKPERSDTEIVAKLRAMIGGSHPWTGDQLRKYLAGEF